MGGVVYYVYITSDNFVTLGNIYRPPTDNNNNTNIEAFINELASLINRFGKEKTANIIVGDFNVHLLKNAEREKYADVLICFVQIASYPRQPFPVDSQNRAVVLSTKFTTNLIQTVVPRK